MPENRQEIEKLKRRQNTLTFFLLLFGIVFIIGALTVPAFITSAKEQAYRDGVLNAAPELELAKSEYRYLDFKLSDLYERVNDLEQRVAAIRRTAEEHPALSFDRQLDDVMLDSEKLAAQIQDAEAEYRTKLEEMERAEAPEDEPPTEDELAAASVPYGLLVNKQTKSFHAVTCPVAQVLTGTLEEWAGTREELISSGFRPNSCCNP